MRKWRTSPKKGGRLIEPFFVAWKFLTVRQFAKGKPLTVPPLQFGAADKIRYNKLADRNGFPRKLKISLAKC